MEKEKCHKDYKDEYTEKLLDSIDLALYGSATKYNPSNVLDLGEIFDWFIYHSDDIDKLNIDAIYFYLKEVAQLKFPDGFNIFDWDPRSFHDIKAWDKFIVRLKDAHTRKNAKFLCLVCQDCHKKFYLNKGEIDFYNNHNYLLPKRCPSCRRKRKENKSNNG